MRACKKSPDLDAFCACGWEVFSKNITHEQMRTGVAREKLADVTTITTNMCADKLPEPVVQQNFIEACIAEESGARPYCECFWSELRKSFSASDLAKPEVAHSEHFVTSARTIAKSTCGPKLPEEAVRTPFISGCTKGNGNLEKFCTCGWREIRAVMTPAEIRMQGSETTPEFKVGMDRVAKKCARFRPNAL
jgi:hypothetical protein